VNKAYGAVCESWQECAVCEVIGSVLCCKAAIGTAKPAVRCGSQLFIDADSWVRYVVHGLCDGCGCWLVWPFAACVRCAAGTSTAWSRVLRWCA
jgi:hypothetical protein